MRIQEAAKAVGCTCRAIKFYEEKGLLPRVARNENGYRAYSQSDILLLHQITAYRKLGISIADIRNILKHDDTSSLQTILDKKRAELKLQKEELEALECYINSRNSQTFNESVDYCSLSAAIREQIPGVIGQYIASHFAPYLSIRIETEEQRAAYQSILEFWDSPSIKLPLSFRFFALLSKLTPGSLGQSMGIKQIDLPEPGSDEYNQMKEKTYKLVCSRENPLIRYNPFEAMKRSMMRALRDCGYYDIFLPKLERLSPPYRAYREKLAKLNDCLSRELNLYYDSAYNLRMIKQQKKDR